MDSSHRRLSSPRPNKRPRSDRPSAMTPLKNEEEARRYYGLLSPASHEAVGFVMPLHGGGDEWNADSEADDLEVHNTAGARRNSATRPGLQQPIESDPSTSPCPVRRCSTRRRSIRMPTRALRSVLSDGNLFNSPPGETRIRNASIKPRNKAVRERENDPKQA